MLVGVRTDGVEEMEAALGKGWGVPLIISGVFRNSCLSLPLLVPSVAVACTACSLSIAEGCVAEGQWERNNRLKR